MSLAVMDGETVDITTDPRFEVWRTPVPEALTAQWRQRRLQMQQCDPIYGRIDETDPYVWAYTIPWNQMIGHQGFLSVPLTIGSQVLGSILLAFRSATPPSAEKIELARVLAQQAAMALHMTRLAERAKQEAMQSVILDERNRMAREIHDTLAQTLVGISIQQQAIEGIIETQEGPLWEEMRLYLDRTNQLVNLGVQEARRSVRALRPQILEQQNLSNALRQMLEQTCTNLIYHCTLQGTPCLLPTTTEESLLRIAQEAVTNVLKHAQASSVYVDLAFSLGYICLSIRDNGRGFDPSLARSGFGLTGMQERATQIAAQLDIISQPENGTTIQVTLPIRSMS